MVALNELVSYTNNLLEIHQFQDYCPNGLQVEGNCAVQTLISGVTASQALLEAAIDANADAILVHHGYFWKGEDPRITGIKKHRIKLLLDSNISLLAYHLPLDAHAIYGNNVQLARLLGFEVRGRFGPGQAPQIGFHGELAQAMFVSDFSIHLQNQLGREALHIAGKSGEIKRVAWCTGAAQNYLESALHLGVDAFITGEVSEQTVHIARESGIHFYSAGHHATERYGAKALGEHLQQFFQLSHHFIDIENPV